jgi:hypothetical protein
VAILNFHAGFTCLYSKRHKTAGMLVGPFSLASHHPPSPVSSSCLSTVLDCTALLLQWLQVTIKEHSGSTASPPLPTVAIIGIAVAAAIIVAITILTTVEVVLSGRSNDKRLSSALGRHFKSRGDDDESDSNISWPPPITPIRALETSEVRPPVKLYGPHESQLATPGEHGIVSNLT